MTKIHTLDGETRHNKTTKKTLEGLSGGIMLIGIGVLFLVDSIDFWPWILLVVGLAGVPGSIAEKGFWAGLQGLIWLGGLSVLFATEMFWPGILILAGLSIMTGALVRPGSPKRKRTIGPAGPDSGLDNDLMDDDEEAR
jgi:hypothetical protein